MCHSNKRAKRTKHPLFLHFCSPSKRPTFWGVEAYFFLKLCLVYALYVGSDRFFWAPAGAIFGSGIGGGIFNVLQTMTDSRKTMFDIDCMTMAGGCFFSLCAFRISSSSSGVPVTWLIPLKLSCATAGL